MAKYDELDVRATDDLQDLEMADAQPEIIIRRKGRGFQSGEQRGDGVLGSAFDKLSSADSAAERAQKSIEGWIVLITGVHEEATEEDISDKFADFGPIKNLHLNLDRRTGYVKGYALVEYENFEEAQEAIKTMNGTKLLGQTLEVDFAFVKPANEERGRRAGGAGGFTSRSRGGRRSDRRSISPSRR
ncbi:hypothetical protein BGW42_001504 [Actinomortierella wolfii]|nr:hypothetical protein BGW42_001504 [Actinomortierella wolfii]KAG0243080.1 hypothetical protein BGW41_002942 [Actinomortierella wolfii]